MLVIDSEKDYTKFKSALQNADSMMIVPIYNNEFMHTKIRQLCLVWVHLVQTNSDYVITMNHSESLFEQSAALLFKDIKDNSISIKYIIDKKEVLYKYLDIPNLVDLEMLNFLDTNTKLIFPKFPVQSFFNHAYNKYANVNSLVPLAKWIEYFELMKPGLLNIITNYSNSDRAFNFYNNIVIPNISKIESSGLSVNLDKINKHLDARININKDEKLIYSQYNIFTTTGRPSNRFNNLNFAALNKEDGSREFIVSRFKKGILIEFDFESYHLRIIANLINYKVPINESMHEFLGKQYFLKNENELLTDDEYEQAKQISFRQLYGGVLKEYDYIEFFTLVEKYIKNLWKDWNTSGYIQSPVSGRKLYKKNYPKLNSQKLFNYLIQLLETELNILKIDEINNYLRNKDTKLVLYCYDSFLFDFNAKDGKQCLIDIQNILESKSNLLDSSKYVVRKYIGKNYSEMEEIKT